MAAERRPGRPCRDCDVVTDNIAFERLRELAKVVGSINRRVEVLETEEPPFGPPGANAQWLTGLLGNGADSEFVINHGLGTYDVSVMLRFADPPRFNVIADIEPTTLDSVKVSFADPPETNQFAFVLIGPPA